MRRLRRLSQLDRVKRHRFGGLFHYYMMYLFLTGLLMTSAGLCLHAIMKADRVDASASQMIKAVIRLNARLRRDASEAKTGRLIDKTAIEFAGGGRLQWKADGTSLQREVFEGNTSTITERFQFPKTTKIEFLADGELLICRVTEPSPVPDTYEAAKHQEKTIEFVLTAGAAIENSDSTAPGDDS